MQVSAFENCFRGHPTSDVRPSSGVVNGIDQRRHLSPKAILMSQQEKSNSADVQRSRVILTGRIRFLSRVPTPIGFSMSRSENLRAGDCFHV